MPKLSPNPSTWLDIPFIAGSVSRASGEPGAPAGPAPTKLLTCYTTFMVTPRRREKAEFQRRCTQCREVDHTMASQSTLRLTHPHCRSCDILMGPGHMANYIAAQCDSCEYLESRGITFGREDE